MGDAETICLEAESAVHHGHYRAQSSRSDEGPVHLWQPTRPKGRYLPAPSAFIWPLIGSLRLNSDMVFSRGAHIILQMA